MSQTDATIVIPALNEAENLGPLLDDCQAQDPPAAEVVVVDAGSTDGTWELLDRRRREWPGLKRVHVAGANAGAARNAGIAAADSPVVATVDAGSRIDPGWVGAMVAALGDVPGPRVAVGTVVADARSDFERAAGWFTLRAFKPVAEAGPIGPAFRPAGRHGFCFTKQVWRAVGGYPEHLPYIEDKLFVERMRSAGGEVVLARDAVVRWRPRESLRAIYRQYEAYARVDAAARLDRQNEFVTIGLYASGLALAILAAFGHAIYGWILAAAIAAYLALFTLPALRDVRPRRAVLWLPLIRLTVDIAKIHGFIAETFGRGKGLRR